MISVKLIVQTVAELTGVDVADVYSARRRPEAIRTRHVAMFLARELTGLSCYEIGRCFGRDHSTIVIASARVGQLAQIDEGLAGLIAAARASIAISAAALARLDQAPPEFDAIDLAERVLSQTPARRSVCADDLGLLCAAMIGAFHSEPDLSPTTVSPDLSAAIRTALDAHSGFASARFSRAEQGEAAKLERAMTALLNTFQEEMSNV